MRPAVSEVGLASMKAGLDRLVDHRSVVCRRASPKALRSSVFESRMTRQMRCSVVHPCVRPEWTIPRGYRLVRSAHITTTRVTGMEPRLETIALATDTDRLGRCHRCYNCRYKV